jgi:hypothetical protein
VGYSQNDSHDFYHDDPIEETSRTKSRFKFLTTGALILGSIFYFQSTLAGNISLSSDTGIEFGQGVSQTVACSGNTNLTLTPSSTFTNVADSTGAHYLSSVTVSNIPDSCFGADFTINAYSDSEGTPLALFNTTSTSAVVHDNGGNFLRGTGSTGMTVASSAGTFTATFTTPVAQSTNVFKLTMQSGSHTAFYDIGSAGPGGGIIYYVNDAGFSCGETFTSTGSPTGGLCHYLEAASTSTWTDATYVWSGNTTTLISPAPSDAIGAGYKNTLAIVGQTSGGNTAGKAGTVSRAYTGGGKSDWYLPSWDELNQMCKWTRGVTGAALTTIATQCTGGTLNSGAGATGFVAFDYFSSHQHSATQVNGQDFADGLKPKILKSNSLTYVRPIRAF